jgi:hypothetical protein
VGGIDTFVRVLAGRDKQRKAQALLLEQGQNLAFERAVAECLAMEVRHIEDARVRRCGNHADSTCQSTESGSPARANSFRTPAPGFARADFHRIGKQDVNDVGK